MATPESKVKDKVKKTLNAFGVYYFMPIGGMYSKIGVPDIICCYNGHFVAIECKAGKNKPTLLQEREIAAIQSAKGWAFVINEDNVDNLEELLRLERNKCDKH